MSPTQLYRVCAECMRVCMRVCVFVLHVRVKDDLATVGTAN